MGDVNYAPLIDEMVWSYSRVRAFEDCPYRWYLKYIRHLRGKDMFFASYGTFMHKNKPTVENADHCICCGAVIPEGRMVCPNCGK